MFDAETELRSLLRDLRGVLNQVDLDDRPHALPTAAPDLLSLARAMIASRSRRYHFFDGALFADPAWDIMLELFVAEIEMREVPVTNLCVTSNVPDSTVLRWIKLLCQKGLLIRRKDKVDKRRVLVQLSRTASDTMRAYLEEQLRYAAREREQMMLGDGGMSMGKAPFPMTKRAD